MVRFYHPRGHVTVSELEMVLRYLESLEDLPIGTPTPQLMVRLRGQKEAKPVYDITLDPDTGKVKIWGNYESGRTTDIKNIVEIDTVSSPSDDDEES